MTRSRANAPGQSEAAILRATLLATSVHPAVGFVWRNNTGAVKRCTSCGYNFDMRAARCPFCRASGAAVLTFGEPGSSDILGIAHGAPSADPCETCGHLPGRGRFLAIEAKSATGRQSDLQRSFERAVLSAGGVYVVARAPTDATNALDAFAHVALDNLSGSSQRPVSPAPISRPSSHAAGVHDGPAASTCDLNGRSPVR